jgi:hypothetical protein
MQTLRHVLIDGLDGAPEGETPDQRLYRMESNLRHFIANDAQRFLWMHCKTDREQKLIMDFCNLLVAKPVSDPDDPSDPQEAA